LEEYLSKSSNQSNEIHHLNDLLAKQEQEFSQIKKDFVYKKKSKKIIFFNKL